MNVECFHFAIDCCWEQDTLFGGAKMLSIGGMGFRCCQHTSVISSQVFSIHQTLNTMAADNRSTEVKLTINEMLLCDIFPRSRWTFEFIFVWLKLKYTAMCSHQKRWVKGFYRRDIDLGRFNSLILAVTVQHQDKMNKPLDCPAFSIHPRGVFSGCLLLVQRTKKPFLMSESWHSFNATT